MDFRKRYSGFFERLDPEFREDDGFVPAVGPLEAEFMLVGEAPGANEVEQGEPFVGRAGKTLDEILHGIGVERSEVYITNLVKVRPPQNRDPKRDEIEAWRPLLDQEFEEVDPESVVALGNFASRELLETSKGISAIHGSEYHVDGRKVYPVFHPAATLYDRSKRPELVEDLRKAFGKTETGQRTLKEL